LYRSEEVEAVMPVDWDASEYNMQHKRRGHAVIFNHVTFEDVRYKPRKGSEFDVKALREKFSSLHFDVTVHDNLEYSKIKEIISECM
jgi:caspase-like apoptosis-related cysteine protease